jgi:hypothetical protein
LEVQQKVLGLDGFWFIVAGVFVASVALGFLFVKLSRPRKLPVPASNAVLRIVSSGTVYRAHFCGEKPGGWAFTPPLQRDNYVPIRVGEPLIIETVMEGGIAIFRTTLKERSTHPPMLIAEKPSFWHIEDRRDSIRIEEIGHVNVSLDGDKVKLLDLSACGARIRSQARHKAGDRVKLEIAGIAESIYGWILDMERKGDRYILRMRFEEETDLSALAGV